MCAGSDSKPRVKSAADIAIEKEIAADDARRETTIRRCAQNVPLEECRAAFECVSEPSADPWMHSDDHSRY